MVDEVYAAFRSVPDYHAGPAPLVSLHRTWEGAARALYPEGDEYQSLFHRWTNKKVWQGPDGFGLIRLMEVKE